MSCVSKFSCTHGSCHFCLICYIQCKFSIACLSIPGIAAPDRCKISNSFTFSFQFQSPAVLFIYIAVFWEDLKRIGEKGERKWCGIIFICSKISLFNFSGYLFLKNWNLLWLLLLAISLSFYLITTTIVRVKHAIHIII